MYYSEPSISDDSLKLKSFKEKSGRPVFLEESVIPAGVQGEISGKIFKNFPRKLKITLEPEEMIFKNIETSFKDEKLIVQTIKFETRKYFKISEDEFVFTYNIWKKDSEGVRLTLIGFSKDKIEQHIPFIRAGFVPWFVIKDFFSCGKGAELRVKLLDGGRESLRIYYNGYLIGLNIYRKDGAQEAKAKTDGYIKSLSLPMPDGAANTDGPSHDKTVSFSTGPHLDALRSLLMAGFLRCTACFAGILILIFIAAAMAQVNVKNQNLRRIDAEIGKLRVENQITDLQSIRKRAVVKGVNIGHVIFTLEQCLPKEIKVSRLELKDGEVTATIHGIDILEANKVKEALESGSDFTKFHIEEGVATNDKKIVFMVKG